MNRIIMIAAMAATNLSLSACGQQPYSQQYAYQDQCMQAANPRECMQVRDAGGNVSEYLMYGMGGYMLAQMMTPSGPRYYMQRDPYYHGAFRPIASYNNSYNYVRSPSYQRYSVVHHVDVSRAPLRPVPATAVQRATGYVPQGSPIVRQNPTVKTIFRPTTPVRSSFGGSTSTRSFSSSSRSSHK